MNSVPRGADAADGATEGLTPQDESIAAAASVPTVRGMERLVEDRIMIG